MWFFLSVGAESTKNWSSIRLTTHSLPFAFKRSNLLGTDHLSTSTAHHTCVVKSKFIWKRWKCIRYSNSSFKWDGLWKWMIFYYSENDVDCDRSCLTSAEGRRKRALDFGTSFSLMADNRSRTKRAVTRSLFPSDRGPIEFLDATGNLIQLERELQKPREYNKVSHHHKDLKKKPDDTISIQKCSNNRNGFACRAHFD